MASATDPKHSLRSFGDRTIPINLDEFLQLDGLEIALKCQEEWEGQADEAFVDFVLDHHEELDPFHLRVAMRILETVNRNDVRAMCELYVDHPDFAVNHSARVFMQRHEEQGWA